MAIAHRLLNPRELRWQHADDRHGDVVDSNDLSNRGGIAAKARAPVASAHDGDRRRGWLIVFRNDRSAEHGVDAEHAIVIAGRDERGRNLGVAIDNYTDAAEGGAREQIAHRPVIGDELPVHRGRERGPHVAASGVGSRKPVVARARHHVVLASPFQANERVGIANGKFLEKQAIDSAEERGVRADAKREREDDHRCPTLGLKEHSNARGEDRESWIQFPGGQLAATLGFNDSRRS